MEKHVKRIAEELTKIRKLMGHQERDKIVNNKLFIKKSNNETIDVDEFRERVNVELERRMGNDKQS